MPLDPGSGTFGQRDHAYRRIALTIRCNEPYPVRLSAKRYNESLKYTATQRMFISIYYAFIFATIGFVVFFQVLFVRSKRYVQLICSVLWLLPVSYEMWALGRCGNDCGRRVDLLMVFPAEVFVLTGASVYSWMLYKRFMARHQ